MVAFGVGMGVAIGIGIGILNFLAAFDTIANSEVYQGILGWSNWIMPMSWLMIGIGIVTFLGNYASNDVKNVKIDWASGSIMVHGGWLSNLNEFQTAFNMGIFTFVHENAVFNEYLNHEIGHSQSLAAFGSVFHLVGFLEEVFFDVGEDAYAERIADSNDPNATAERAAEGSKPIIPMWV